MGATNCILLDTNRGNEPSMEFDVNNGRDILAHYLSGTEVFALMSDGFIRTTSGWATRHAALGLGDIAADSDAYTFPIFRAKHDVTITDVSVGVDTTVASNTTNYETIYLEQTGNTTDLGTLTNNGTAFNAKVPRSFTIATTGDPDHLKAGQTLTIRFVKAAAGAAFSGVVVSFTYTIDQPNATIGTATENVLRFFDDVGTSAVIQVTNQAGRDHLVLRENSIEKFRIDLNGKMIGSSPDQYYYHVANVGAVIAADSAAKKSIIFKPHGTVDIERVYIGSASTALADSETAFMQVKVTDATATLCDAYIHGPASEGIALTKGQLYDMGEVNAAFKRVTSSEQIQLEYLATGSPSTIDGLTAVICFKKVD